MPIIWTHLNSEQILMTSSLKNIFSHIAILDPGVSKYKAYSDHKDPAFMDLP